jgi:hypothetical protein
MSDDEDDYLSDKFLASLEAPKSSSSKTYSEIRKESKLRSERLQQTNRVKSRRERELEAREEALSKTLFERAEEDAQKAGDGGGNKALAMMMKMGFKPGQALGQEDGVGKGLTKVPDEEDLAPSDIATQTPDPTPPSPKRRGNLKEPLPLNEWMGELSFLPLVLPAAHNQPMSMRNTHTIHTQARKGSVSAASEPCLHPLLKAWLKQPN